MLEKNLKARQLELAEIRRKINALQWEQREIQAQLVTDPEKNTKLYELAEIMYIKVLEEAVSDSTNVRTSLKKIASSLNEKEFSFYSQHKYDFFNKSLKLFKLYEDHPIQKSLVTGSYIGTRLLKGKKDLQQVLKFILEAKIIQQKDILIAEYKALRKQLETKENLSNLVDLNLVKTPTDKELLILLKSDSKLSQKELAERVGLSVSTVKRRIDQFKEDGLL